MTFKQVSLAIIATALFSSSFSQDQTINLGVSLNKKVYVNLNNGSNTSYDNSAWELAFDNRAQNAAILVNDANQIEIHFLDNQTNFKSLDTTGFSNSNALQNAWDSWESGALNDVANPQNPFDYGWGEYNMSTHTVQGERVFILKTSNGNVKKVLIEDLANNKYYVRYADINGSNEVNVEIDRSKFQNRRFTYFDFDNNELLNLEPDSTAWDFVFTSYSQSAGILLNYQVAALTFEKGTQSNWESQENLSSSIQTIGKTWLEENSTSLANLAYQVNARSGVNYWLTITDAQLKSSGKITYKVGDITSVSNLHLNNRELVIFPNPLLQGNNLNVIAKSSSSYSFYNAAGALIQQGQLEKGQNNLKTSTFSTGLYYLKSTSTKTLIIY